MVARVNGGILTDQMLKGKLRCFIMASAAPVFTYTMGTEDGVLIPDQTILAGPGVVPDSYDILIFENQPVPDSAADKAFRIISQRCTVSLIRIISASEIHFLVSNTNGWDDTSEVDPPNAAANMQAAVRLLGAALAVPAPVADGAYTVDMSAVTITEVPFILEEV